VVRTIPRIDFEFLRNETERKRLYFQPSSGSGFGRESNGDAKRAPFRYNNFGGTIGGPFMSPDLGGRTRGEKLKRTYFFSEELRWDIRYLTLTGSVLILICVTAFS
jgi:hypothetical protein